jgi:hypothetical protein
VTEILRTGVFGGGRGAIDQMEFCREVYLPWEELSTEEFPVRGGSFFMEGEPELPTLFKKRSEIIYKKVISTESKEQH